MQPRGRYFAAVKFNAVLGEKHFTGRHFMPVKHRETPRAEKWFSVHSEKCSTVISSPQFSNGKHQLEYVTLFYLTVEISPEDERIFQWL